MFSDSTKKLLFDSMKISNISIEERLNEPDLKNDKEIIIKAIEEFSAVARKEQIYSVLNVFNRYCNNCSLSESGRQVLDAMRHSFATYVSGGLHDLYIYQENEEWHPKIILNCILYPNDNSKLNSELIIYRGCDVSEHQNFNYGQSWTACIQIAHQFAFEHYNNQSWFDKSQRVILQASYSQADVLYSKELPEHEVVVSVKKLKNIIIK